MKKKKKKNPQFQSYKHMQGTYAKKGLWPHLLYMIPRLFFMQVLAKE